MRTLDKEQSEEENQPSLEQFQNAKDYTPDQYVKALQTCYGRWFEGINNLLTLAKDGAPNNNGIAINLTVGLVSGGIDYKPPIIRYSRRQEQQKPTKKATRADIEGIISEDQGSIELTETDTEFRITPTSYLDDRWKPIMNALNTFEGAKWNRASGDTKAHWSVSK